MMVFAKNRKRVNLQRMEGWQRHGPVASLKSPLQTLKNSVMLSVHSLHLTPVQKKLKKTVSFQRMKLINCGFYTRDSQQPKAVWTTYSSTWLYSSGGKSKRWGEKNPLFFSTTSTENHSMMFGDVFKKSSFFLFFRSPSQVFITVMIYLLPSCYFLYIYTFFFQYTHEYALFFFKTFLFFPQQYYHYYFRHGDLESDTIILIAVVSILGVHE